MSMLPWLINSTEDASVALWDAYETDLADKGLYDDAELLSLFHFAGGQAYTLDETPINSVADLRDRQMWALLGSAAKILFEERISPVTTPAVQISESVPSGVVDGIFGLSMESVRDFRIGTYVKSATEFSTWVSSISFSLPLPGLLPMTWSCATCSIGLYLGVNELNQAMLAILLGFGFIICVHQRGHIRVTLFENLLVRVLGDRVYRA